MSELNVLDSPGEPEFDALVRAAALACGAPVSLISLVDRERQWFKAKLGLPGVSETPRALAFCAHTILGSGLFEVRDALTDVRFADNPLVTGEPNIRFYAGVTLALRDGAHVGTLCVIDRVPRVLDASQREILSCLAAAAASALERRRDAHAWSESEARHRELNQSAPDAIISVDREQRVVLFNAAAEAMFQCSVAEALGQCIDRFIPARFRVEHAAHIDRFGLKPTTSRPMHSPGKLFGLRADGSEFPIEASISQTRVTGEPLFTVILRDVTERVRLEAHVQQRTAELSAANAALQQVSARLATAQQITHVGSWEYDLASGVVTWSSELFRMMALAEADTAPALPQQEALFEPESWLRLAAAVVKCVADGSPYELELELLERGIGRRWAIGRGEARRTSDGSIVGLVGTLQDVTELHLARHEQLAQKHQLERTGAQLREMLTFQRAIMNAAGMAIISSDSSGAIDTINRAGQQMLQYDEAELLGRTPALFHKSEEVLARAQQLSEETGQVVEPGFEVFVGKARAGHVDQREWTYVRKDGSEFPVLLSVSALRDELGVITGFLGVAADLTKLRQAQARLEEQRTELERSNEELQQFAYVASHDLQEPLRAVAGCAQLLAASYRGKLDASADELITHMVEGAERMRALIQDLLALSRVSAHTRDLTLSDTQEVCQVAVANLATAIRESEGTVTVARLPSLMGDRGQLVQLFQNLIANALKYRAEGRRPEVLISCRVLPAEYVFSVRDNGIGIEAQYFERIFGLFQRLHTRLQYTGTGIGLAICKKVVQRHQGRIWVESTPGSGTTFFFSIPRQRQTLAP